MVTFKTVIRKDRKHEDGTWTVFIRITHNRKTRYMATSMCVGKKDLTASLKIKNQRIIDKCDELMLSYRKSVMELNLELNDMDIDAIVRYIQSTKGRNAVIDFTEYFREIWCKKHVYIKGIRNYIAAFHSFQVFMGREAIWHNDVTAKSLAAFSDYLRDKPRAQSLYTSSITRVFNDMRDYYNDEDNGIIRIKHSLNKFKVPRQNVAKQRALTVENMRRLFVLPYDNAMIKGKSSRHDLALDCFRLSFCLMGMNSADLYNATEYDGENITYYRTKTKDRRKDEAKMVIRVHPCIKSLVDKYRGVDHVFNFSERFGSMEALNRAINIGLKEVGLEIGIEHLQFYSARHSFATIAVNDAKIPIYIVNDMLCHVDVSMKTTLLYVKKDYSISNDANFRLLDFMFGGEYDLR